jgi:hypothetical protein
MATIHINRAPSMCQEPIEQIGTLGDLGDDLDIVSVGIDLLREELGENRRARFLLNALVDQLSEGMSVTAELRRKCDDVTEAAR